MNSKNEYPLSNTEKQAALLELKPIERSLDSSPTVDEAAKEKRLRELRSRPGIKELLAKHKAVTAKLRKAGLCVELWSSGPVIRLTDCENDLLRKQAIKEISGKRADLSNVRMGIAMAHDRKEIMDFLKYALTLVKVG